MFLWIHFKKKVRGISEIEKFYMEDCPNTAGYTLEYILGQSDSWLEQKHDYIQWLFPTAKSSCFNPKAPVISQKSADKLIQKYGDALKDYQELFPDGKILRLPRVLYRWKFRRC